MAVLSRRFETAIIFERVSTLMDQHDICCRKASRVTYNVGMADGVQAFDSQAAAKRFYVERIVRQAADEGVSLSQAEQWMLSFSESDRDFIVDPAIVARFESEISADAYESKIAGLIRRAYQRDVAVDARARAVYESARRVMEGGDRYLLIMIDRAIAMTQPWWIVLRDHLWPFAYRGRAS